MWVKVALCTPVYGEHVRALFALNYGELCAFAAGHTINGERVETKQFIRAGFLPRVRNTLKDDALDWGADYILWLDADQTFPRETFHQLYSHGLPIVGANYRTRIGQGWTAIIANGDTINRVETTREKIEAKLVEPVTMLGMGVLLTSAEVFRNIATNPFRFETDGTVEIGEDGTFMLDAAKAGYQPHVDHHLSAHVGHIAETVLTAF